MEENEDVIDYVLIKTFSNVSYEMKCEIKNKQPKPHLSLNQRDGKVIRKFQNSWYDKYPWFTGSVVREKLYCFGCLLFGGDNEWGKKGISAVKNFERKAQKHQVSQKHIQNRERFHMLGRRRIEHVLSEGAFASAIKHNERVKINRNIVGRIIDVVCFLGRQELAFRGHREDETSLNKGNYLEMLDLLAEQEIVMRDYLESNTVSKGTSSDIQNEVIATVTQVLNDTIRKEILEAEFISVQADETTDVSCKCQLSIVLRYCFEDRIEERFVGFYDVSKDKNAEQLSTVIFNVLKEWKVDKKLICQTYDGASVMAGERGGVQHFIKQYCPNALFIHCYAHQLNLVLLHGSKTIPQVRIFISNLTAFHTFFSRSSKRATLLTDQGFKLPSAVSTRWNYHSRAATTIKAHFKELGRAFKHIVDNQDWDPITLNMAIGLSNHLKNSTFVFLLVLFSRIFVHTDHVFKILQTKCSSDVILCNNEIKAMTTSLKEMRCETCIRECCEDSVQLNNDLGFSEKLTSQLRALTYEIIDSLTVQLELRFKDFESLEFVELVNKSQFCEYKFTFPEKKFQQLLKAYPVFEREQLQNELTIIYADETKYLGPQELLKYIFENDLCEVYIQLTKLLRLILTLPVTTASSERNMSTLKRIKSYLRNSMENSRLSNLSTLSIEKSLLKSLAKNSTFKDNVIDKFAVSKNRRLDLI